MSIAVAILLMALGAILYFATDLRVSGIDLDAVGVILMVAGAVGLVVTMALLGRRRTVVTPDEDVMLPVEAPTHVHPQQAPPVLPPPTGYQPRA